MEWKEVTLGEITNLVIDYRGKTPLKLGSSWSDSGYRALSAKNIKTGQIVAEDSIRFVDEELYRKWMKDEVKRGDILITSEAPFGQIYYWDSDEKIVLSQRLFDVRLNDEVCHKYVYYFMTSHRYQKDLEGRATGTTVTGLRQPELLKSTILLPSLSAQRSIASILSSLDRKIELNNKINADLEEMAQAIFKNWFVDFEPFKDGKFVDSELGMIPEGWKVGTLEDIAEITMGQSPAGNSLNENGEGMIFYQGSSDFGFRFPSIRVFTTEPKRLAVANSVLFSVRAPVGDINVAKEECCIGRGVASIKSKYGHDSYLFYAMKSLHKLFDSFDGEGTVFGSINKKTLSAIQILLPSDGIVEQFNDIASSFDNRIRSLSEENSRLSLLRDTLLPRLTSGELEVPE